MLILKKITVLMIIIYLKSPIALRKSIILLVGTSLKRSFTVFILKYFMRI